jgi:hypothetical protein
MNFIVITGNPVNGFQAVGPFETRQEALECGEGLKEDWWIMEVHKP